MPWLELSVDVRQEAVDWVATLLAAHEFSGEVSIAPWNTSSAGFPGEAEPAPWDYTVRWYLPGSPASNALVSKLAEALSPLERVGLIDALHTRLVAEQQPSSNTRRLLEQRIGQRFVLLPPDAKQRSQDTLAIRLAPSLAFGSGLHPATTLSLQLLERHVRAGMQVLDLGSGSGILSVAMAKIGARVVALDNDPVAVAATQDAVRRNGVAQNVTVMHGSLGAGSNLGHWMGWTTFDDVPVVTHEPFDLIVANILARMHLALAADYQQALKRGAGGGVLITAGYATDREEVVTEALQAVGFSALDRVQDEEWVALAHVLDA